MQHPPARDGAPVRVDEGLFAQINGADQWLTVRGDDRANSTLLILSGPGVAFSRMAPLFAPWERNFTLVQWDQPGAGAALARQAPDSHTRLSLERLIDDAAAVVEFIRGRLGAQKIAVLGVSGGSVVGLTLTHRRPDLVSAYVGTGQFTHYARQDALSYARVLKQVSASGDPAAVAELKVLGPPPWPDAAADAVVSRYAGALTPAEQAVFTPELMATMAPQPSDARAQAMAAYAVLRDDLKAFDARRLGLAFEVPVLFVQGADDRYSVTSEVEAYANTITAPRKRFTTLAGGGHSCLFLREAFLAELNDFLQPEKNRSGG